MQTITLRDKIFSRLKAYSKAKNIPIEKFVEASIDERLTQLEQWDQIRARLPKASREDFLRILHSAPDRPPMKGDEWPPMNRKSRGSQTRTKRARTTTKRTKKTA